MEQELTFLRFIYSFGDGGCDVYSANISIVFTNQTHAFICNPNSGKIVVMAILTCMFFSAITVF